MTIEKTIIQRTTQNSILENIQNVLIDNCEFSMEDLSGGKQAENTFFRLQAAQLIYDSNNSENNLYDVVAFDVFVYFKSLTPLSARSESIEVIHKMRNNLVLSNLNVKDLKFSKLVRSVVHVYNLCRYEIPTSFVNYRVHVKYRNS